MTWWAQNSWLRTRTAEQDRVKDESGLLRQQRPERGNSFSPFSFGVPSTQRKVLFLSWWGSDKQGRQGSGGQTQSEAANLPLSLLLLV